MPLKWLYEPGVFHSSREAGPRNYSLTTATQWDLLESQWLNWYTSDWDYARNTALLFCAGIAVVALCEIAMVVKAKMSSKRHNTALSNGIDSLIAIGRYAANRQFYFAIFDWYTPSLAVVVTLAGLFIFIMALTFAVRPYYWTPDYGHYAHVPPLGTRAGWLSLGILPFMIAFATKVNWIGLLTGTSHEKLQVFHRWTALLMYITSLIHTFPYIVRNINAGEMEQQWTNTMCYWSGTAALVPQTYLVFLSWGICRNRYYEIFKKLHFCAAGVFMGALFVHVDARLTAWDYMLAAGVIYVLAWLIRVGRTHYNSGVRGIPATIHFVTPTIVKVSIEVPGRLKWAPGQHVFVRFLGLGLVFFASHPFTIASVRRRPVAVSADGKKKADEEVNNTLDLVMRVKKGVTRTLVRSVGTKGSKAIRVFVDGPYGGVPFALRDFNTVYLISGGSGATFTMPIVLDLISGATGGNGMLCTSVNVIIAVRSIGDIVWMKDDLELVRRLAGDGLLNIQVYVTAEGGEQESDSEKNAEDSTFEQVSGRPQLPKLISDATQHATGRLVFIASGPTSLLHDVRNAVAECEKEIITRKCGCREIYLHTENFGW